MHVTWRYRDAGTNECEYSPPRQSPFRRTCFAQLVSCEYTSSDRNDVSFCLRTTLHSLPTAAMPSVRSSKRQTRLPFTPVPSSSPQVANLPSSLRSRAAAISYDGIESPTKRRKIAHLPGSGISSISVSTASPPSMSFSPFARMPGAVKRQSHLLPTPEASSQARNGQSAISQLFFVQGTGSISLLTRMIASTSDFEVHSGSDSDSDSSLPSLRTLTTTPRKPKPTPSKPANRVQEEEQDTTNDEDGDDLPARPLRSAGAHHIVISSDDESDGDITPLSSPKRRTAHTSTPTLTSRKPAVVTPSKQKQPYSSSRRTRSSGLPILPPSTIGSTRRSTRLQTRKSIAEPREGEFTTVPEGSSQNLPDSENESDVVTPTRSSRSGKHPRRQTLDLGESETSGDAERSPTKKIRLMRPVEKSIPPKKLNKQDEEDLEEDLEILQDTGTVIRLCGLRVSYIDFQVQRCVTVVLEAGQLLQKNKPPRNNWTS